MNETFKYDVFLSHSAKDELVARQLAKRLEDDGLRVWFAEWQLNPPERAATRRKKMERALEQSRALVLCVSGNVTIAEWDMLEHQTARFRNPANVQRRFIPLRLDDVEIKDALKQFDYVDWRQRSAEQYAELLAACRPQSSKVLEGHTDSVFGVAVSADGRRAVHCA